jgi:hypothetical protein
MVIAPTDAGLFSASAFAFAEANQDAVSSLLGRTRADGGGDSFYDLDAGGPAARGWIQFVGQVIDPPSADGSRFRVVSGGLQGGADLTLGNGLRLGAALGYQDGSLHDSNGGAAQQSLVQASLYASQTLGPLGVSAVVTYAHGWDDTHRATGVGAASASRDLDEVSGAVEVSAPFAAGGLQVTPAAGVTFFEVRTSRFQEASAAPGFAVTGGATHGSGASPYAQVGLSHAFTTASGVTLTPDVVVGYRYDAAAVGLHQTLIAADGTVFSGARLALSRDSALVGASLTAHHEGWTAFVKYRATVAGDWSDQSVQAGVRIAF